MSSTGREISLYVSAKYRTSSCATLGSCDHCWEPHFVDLCSTSLVPRLFLVSLSPARGRGNEPGNEASASLLPPLILWSYIWAYINCLANSATSTIYSVLLVLVSKATVLECSQCSQSVVKACKISPCTQWHSGKVISCSWTLPEVFLQFSICSLTCIHTRVPSTVNRPLHMAQIW